MRIAYLECFSGISGDMLLGALVDAGVSFDLLAETTLALNVGAHLEKRKVSRGGIAGTKVDVLIAEGTAADHTHPDEPGAHEHTHGPAVADTPTHSHAHAHSHAHSYDGDDAHSHDPAVAGEHTHEHSHEHTHENHRSLSTILGIIHKAPLAEDVKARASRAFQLLGEAEAAIHQIPLEQHAFSRGRCRRHHRRHCLRRCWMRSLGVDRWLASPLNVGSGTVQCAHGTLPVPAPATLGFARRCTGLCGWSAHGARHTDRRRNFAHARCATMHRCLPCASRPRGMVQADETRLGSRTWSVSWLENPPTDMATEPIAILETVIDDSSPQLIAYVSELLLEAGAWDVYRVQRPDEEGPHRRAADGALPARSYPRAARSDFARNHHHRLALAHRRTRYHWRASSPKCRRQWGPVQHQDRTLAFGRSGQRCCRIRRLPALWPVSIPCR